MSFGSKTPGAVHSLAKRYVAVMDAVATVIWWVAIALLAVLTLLVVGSVLSRQLLGFVPVWSGELQRYLAIWMTMLLAGVLVYEDNHLGVRLFTHRLPDSVEFRLRVVQLLLTVAVGVVLVNWGFEYVLDSGTASTSASMGFQMLWVYLVLPVTGWLIVLFGVARLIVVLEDPDRATDDDIDFVEEEGA